MTHIGNHESWRSRKKKKIPTLFLQAWGARWRQSWLTLAIMTHVGIHDSRQSTALLYQFLRWNLSCNISWVGRNLLFKLGFLVPLRTEEFSCYNPTETRVREITRHREWSKKYEVSTTVPSTFVLWEKSLFFPSYDSSPMLSTEASGRNSSPCFCREPTVGIIRREKKRFFPQDNCTGHCSIVPSQFYWMILEWLRKEGNFRPTQTYSTTDRLRLS